ncbi:hypothetical protein Tco_0673141 [Tanacetum coccineum]
MFVDGGSSMEVLYEHCFNRLRIEIKSQMVPATTSLTGFSRETIWPLGKLRLLVTIGDAEHFTKAWMNFMIVRSPSPYNALSCAKQVAPTSRQLKRLQEKEEGGQENLKVAIHHDFSDQEVALGGTLSIEGRTALCALLKRNLDIFAWQPSDMTGVPRQTAEHRLNIRDGYPPVRQKKRGQASERAKAIQTERQKLLENVHRLHESKQGLPAGLYPCPEIDWKSRIPLLYPFKCSLGHTRLIIRYEMAEEDEEKRPSIPLRRAVEGIVPRIYDWPGRHKTMPREDRSYVATSIPIDSQGGSEPQREVTGLNRFLSRVSGKHPAALQNLRNA